MSSAKYPPCTWCGKPCRTIFSRLRIHSLCNSDRVAQYTTIDESDSDGSQLSTADTAAAEVLDALQQQMSASSSSTRTPDYINSTPRSVCLAERGFAFIPSIGREFAVEFSTTMGAYIHKAPGQKISGDVRQYALPKTGQSVWAQGLRVKWHALVAQLAAAVGINVNQLQLHVQDEKLLVAHPGQGLQAVHFDRDDTPDKLKQVYTIILYLTDYASSTAFPKFKLSECALPEFTSSLESEVTNPEALIQSVERGFLKDENYESWTVMSGDMAIFTQATMHYGTACKTLHDRFALFSVLTPFPDKHQDDYQIYRWMYTSYAYGVESRQLAEAVWCDREFKPLDRFSQNTAGKASKEAYHRSLIRWGVIKWKTGTKQFEWAQPSAFRSTPLSNEEVHFQMFGS